MYFECKHLFIVDAVMWTADSHLFHRAFGCVCYTEGVPAGHIKVSMRSVGDVDVSAVARALQGGGHKNASACVVRQEMLESWRR